MAKYEVHTASNGKTVYTKKPSKLQEFMNKKRAEKIRQNDNAYIQKVKRETNNNGRAIQQAVHDVSSWGKREAIDKNIKDLKSNLEKKNSERLSILKQDSDPNNAPAKGDQRKGTNEHMIKVNKEIDKIISDLSHLGVKVKRESLSMNKIQYSEGGNSDMLNVDDIKKMKLDVFEDASKGKISDNMKNYLITYFEGVQTWVENHEGDTAFIESQRDEFSAFVIESMSNGSITRKQGEVLLELAEDDEILYETAQNDIPSLVRSFLEAAKEGDEEKKEEIKGKIEDAKNGGKAGCDSFSVSAKLEELAVKLTDDEKAVVAQIDEKIKSACKVNDKEVPAEDVPAEGETVEESVNRYFESVNVRFSGHENLREKMDEYLTESVESGLYTSADARRIASAMEKMGC